MALQLVNLDERTRTFMGEELQWDIDNGALYISNRLTDAGRVRWPGALREAIDQGDDASLAAELHSPGYLNTTEQRRKPSGGFSTAQGPATAPETLAEGEFNRFYIRGVCRRAIADTMPTVVVYRAKAVERPRTESEAKIGKQVDAQRLLDDLHTSQGIDTALGLPAGPNSGLSIRLP
jgi:hypothetical protein